MFNAVWLPHYPCYWRREEAGVDESTTQSKTLLHIPATSIPSGTFVGQLLKDTVDK